jgi:DNA repair protein SbcC/Rad50
MHGRRATQALHLETLFKRTMKSIIQRFLHRFMQPASSDPARAAVAPGARRYAQHHSQVVQAPASVQTPDPVAGDPPSRWVDAICTSTDQLQALMWLDQLHEEADFATVAIRGRVADVRLSAAQRIHAEATLKRIAEQVQHKDKSVYRLCQLALKNAAHGRQRRTQIDTLERKLQTLLASEPLPAGRRFELQQALTQLSPGDDLQNCEQQLQEALARELAEAELLRNLGTLQAQATHAQAQLAEEPILQLTQIDEFRSLVATLREQRTHWPAWLTAHKLGEKLQAVLADIEQRLAVATTDVARMEECTRFLAAQATTAITKISSNAWAAMPKPNGRDARATLDAQWETLRAQQSAPAPPQILTPVVRTRPERPAFDRAAFVAGLEQMELAMERGETLAARDLSRTLHDTLGQAKLDGRLAARYRQALQSLNRLRGWARWGGDHVRAELLDAAAALLADDVDIEERRIKVPQLRAAWNRLNVQGPAPVGQRERFNALLDEAFQPVLNERAAAAALRAEARSAHEARLREWETWLQQIVWDQADLQLIQKQWQTIRTERRALPALQGPDARRSARRFALIAADIKAHLDPIGKAEIERRGALIAAVTRLQDAHDLTHALRQARGLQQRWREEAAPVLLKRQVSEELWQRFRVAIDILYARRTEQRSAQSAAAEQQRAQREQILTTFAAAIAAANTPAQITEARAEFDNAWQTATESDTRASVPARIQALLDTADAKLKSFEAERQQAFFQYLADKAALAERLEHVAVAGAADPALVSEIEAQWKDIPAIPGGAERLLEARLHAAPTATDERLQKGREVRDIALLDLEIWLDIPTPDPRVEQRRQRQLQLLQSGSNRKQSSEQLRTAVARWYATTAQPDPLQQERIQRVVQQLSQVPLAQSNQTLS